MKRLLALAVLLSADARAAFVVASPGTTAGAQASAPTCGTAVVHSVPLSNTAATTSSIATSLVSTIPLANFTTGIGVCASTTQTGATTCAATVSCTIWYK